MVRRSLIVVLVGLITLSLVGVAPVLSGTARAQEAASNQEDVASSPVASYADDELVAALGATSLTDEWVRSSGVSPEAALVTVFAGADYADARAAFLVSLWQLAERNDHLSERAENADDIESNVEVLEELIRGLRRDIAVGGRTAAVSLTSAEADQAQIALANIVGSQRWMGISLDPYALAEHRLVAVRDDLSREIDELSRLGSQRSKSADATVTRLTALHNDLQRVRSLVETGRQRSMTAQIDLVVHRGTVASLMDDLHQRRLLSPTSVGGLPVVTFDAYVQGADALDSACPVDWNLLAGIGRVESFHGTLGDSTVQGSGRLTNPILGPLLDGGATEREAEAAKVAADEAALLAEQEAVEPEEPPAPAFEASVWGDDTLARAEEVEESAAADRDPVGLAAPPVVVEEVPTPRYDPRLWGDDLPFEIEDLPDADEDDSDENDGDEEIPELRGNGFAVINDSDNGRLDGNSRWDRAVGPMQFIPETWSYWETDGNGDGVADPQNLYDAAATAGQFLCHLSRTRGSSPYSFVLGYNSSQTYVSNVMAAADGFGAAELPTVSD